MKFKNMNVWSKILFIVGWIGVIGSILTLVIGVLATVKTDIFGAEFISQYDFVIPGISGSTLVQSVGIALIIMGIISIIESWLSIRAAKNNKKIMLALILTVIDTIMNVWACISSSSASSYISGVIINVICLVACVKIVQNNKKAA